MLCRPNSQGYLPMTRKLNDADRAAVDMLFDRLNTAGIGNSNGGDGYVTMTDAVDDQRLAAIETILQTLSHLPAPEPSSDLAVRTLQRIANATPLSAPMATPAEEQLPAMPFLNPNQPLA